MGFFGVRKCCCLLPTHSEILLLHCELKDFFFILYYFYPNSVILILQMEALYSKLYDKYTKLKVNVTMCIFIYLLLLYFNDAVFGHSENFAITAKNTSS